MNHSLKDRPTRGFRHAPLLALVVMLSMAAPPPLNAQGDGWSPWQSIGNNLSVSFSKVSLTKDTWTWKFRNDAPRKMTYMSFMYTDVEGDHPDWFPGSLEPGKVLGGWAAFTASSRPTRIVIREIKYEGDDMSTASSARVSEQTYRAEWQAMQRELTQLRQEVGAAKQRGQLLGNAGETLVERARQAQITVDRLGSKAGYQTPTRDAFELAKQLRADLERERRSLAIAVSEGVSAARASEGYAATQPPPATAPAPVYSPSSPDPVATPEISSEDVGQVFEMIGMIATGFQPKMFSTSRYDGQMDVDVGSATYRTDASASGPAEKLSGLRGGFGLNAIRWRGMVGGELGGHLGGAWLKGTVANDVSRELAKYSGSATGRLWFGPLGVGAVGRYDQVNAKESSDASNAGSNATTKRFISGPVVSLANNNFGGARLMLSYYSLTGTWRGDTAAVSAMGDMKKSRVTGYIGEFGLGAYFVRVDVSKEAIRFPPIGTTFKRQTQISGGFRMTSIMIN